MLYVGSTNDLKRRLREHQQGQCESTACRRPVELEAYVAVKSESTARSLEGQFKTGSGIATLRQRILASEASTIFCIKEPHVRPAVLRWQMRGCNSTPPMTS